MSPEAIAEFHDLIRNGTLAEMVAAVKAGADFDAQGHLGQTALMVAIDEGDMDKVTWLVDQGADLDLMCDFNSTALGRAVNNDLLPAIKLLIERGADRGHRRKYPGHSLAEMLDPSIPAFPESLRDVMTEEEWKENMSLGLDILKDREVPVIPYIRDVQSLAALRLFTAAGEALGNAPQNLKSELLHLPESEALMATRDEFQRDRTRRFGTANPEKFDSAFWNDMVRRGCNSYAARTHYDHQSQDYSVPIWCNDRFGTSLTELPDGRFIQIGGEHEDYYDPDFCIYNDCIVFDGQGNFEIYGYPRELFPPTDFHSATLVGDWIYIIGSLGYMGERQVGHTPVYRLHPHSLAIEHVTTSGDGPSWIHDHLAIWHPERNAIRIIYGNVQDASGELVPNNDVYWFNVELSHWHRD